MPDPTPAQVRRAALLALVWWTAGGRGQGAVCVSAMEALESLGLSLVGDSDTARAYLEAAQRELASMEEGGAK